MDALDLVERDLFGQAIIEQRGAGRLVPRDPGRDLEVAAVSQVLGDPGAAEAVSADLGGESRLSGAALDHLQRAQARHCPILERIAPPGLAKAQALDPGPLGIVHDFVVTAQHLVIVIPPLVYELPHEGELLDGFVWRPVLGTRVLVIDKNDFSDRRWVQLPAAFGFHHGNRWEDADGVVRYDHCIARYRLISQRTRLATTPDRLFLIIHNC